MEESQLETSVLIVAWGYVDGCGVRGNENTYLHILELSLPRKQPCLPVRKNSLSNSMKSEQYDTKKKITSGQIFLENGPKLISYLHYLLYLLNCKGITLIMIRILLHLLFYILLFMNIM